MDLLRFNTCGSVDDGKSTLIGRLLYDSKMLFDDQLEKMENARLIGGEMNYADMLDGLKEEREQGITIDVAYRYFATPKRKFIVADTPGHIQYTRNMVTGASTANLSLILIDARKGVIEQTRRHSYIASLLGIPHICVCINKMDLVDFSEDVYNEIVQAYEELSKNLDIKQISYIPLSALNGDNVVEKSENMPWYDGPAVLDFLETVHIANDRNLDNPRFPVQYVIRPRSDEYHDYRAFAGQVASGTFKVGDEVFILPSIKKSIISKIDLLEKDIPVAFPPMSCNIHLKDEIECSRGMMIVPVDDVPQMSQELEAMVCWMHDTPLQKNKKYIIKHTTNSTRCMVRELEYKINIETLEQEEVTSLELNEIGKIKIYTQAPLIFDDYRKNRQTGGFIIVDEATNATVAAGMLRESDHKDEEYVI
ncbi:MAG: sulfate adenylyltransferase [Lentisphaeria bacterium]|nr:GTP-binding protein [Lentisphaeria bacterium]NQZ67931.1 sulfate adenylyltransferase [Lentisphaeria bacterium]